MNVKRHACDDGHGGRASGRTARGLFARLHGHLRPGRALALAGACALAAALLSTASSPASAAVQASFYVSPTGSDSNPGTISQPFLTLAKAQQAVEAVNSDMTGDIDVYLRGGTYAITNPLQFTTADSGTNGHNVVYEAYPGEDPVVSGGVQVTGWTAVPGRTGLYEAPLARSTVLRSLYVNGVRANMTSETLTPEGGTGSFTVAGTEPWATSDGAGTYADSDGINFSSAALGSLTNPQDIEISQSKVWSQETVGVAGLTTSGGTTELQLQQPMGAYAINMGASWGGNLNPSEPLQVMNAFELIKNPGDFYFNRTTQELYYQSRGENMATATVIAPTSPGLMQITGTSTSDRVQNLQFEGITFSFDSYGLSSLGPSTGFVGPQSSAVVGLFDDVGNANEMHQTHYADLTLPQSTVDVRNASSVLFESDTFTDLGSPIDLNFENDVVNSQAIGNVFHDTDGNAINLGNPQNWATTATWQYPAGVNGPCSNDQISDNLISSVSQVYNQIESISGYEVQYVTISHNDVLNSPYGGIALGYDWGKPGIAQTTVPENNRILDNLVENTQLVLSGDGGDIYTLGPEPYGLISGNYVVNGRRLLYTDEGSSGWDITSNVFQNASADWLYVWTSTIHNEFINNNWTNNSAQVQNGTDITLTNTHDETLPFDATAESVIANAGLEPQWKGLLTSYAFNPLLEYAVVNRATGLALDNGGAAQASGSGTVQAADDAAADPDQQYQITSVGNGLSSLIASSNGLALDDRGDATAGDPMGQWPYDGSPHLQWQIIPLTGGYYELLNSNGYALDGNGATANGAAVAQNPYSGSASQQWSIIPVPVFSPATEYAVVNRGTGQVLDDGGNPQGSNTQQWSDLVSTDANQQYAITPVGAGAYSLTASSNGLSLDDRGSPAAGAAMGQWAYDGSPHLQWQIIPLSGGYYELLNSNGYALDGNGATANGAAVVQNTYTGGDDQQWSIVPLPLLNPGVQYAVVNRATGLVLDNGDGAQNSDTQQWAGQAATDPNQQYTVTPEGTGIYALTGQSNGLALDDRGDTTPGDAMGQWAYDNDPHLQWQVIPAGGGYYELLNSDGYALDGNGATANGSPVVQNAYSASASQQWEFVPLN